MNDKKTHAFILRRIEQLPEEEQDQLITKYQGGTNHIYEVTSMSPSSYQINQSSNQFIFESR